MRFMPSTEEPVQFAENINKATLVLPSETPGYRIVPDIKVLEVRTALCFDWCVCCEKNTQDQNVPGKLETIPIVS